MSPNRPIKMKNIMSQSESSIYLAHSIRLYRNLSKFPFPNKLSHVDSLRVLEFISHELLHHPQINKPKFTSGKTLKSDDKEYLVEHFLLKGSLNQAYENEGFVYNEEGTLLALINLDEHLEIIRLHPGENLEETLKEITSLEKHLSQRLDFSFSKKFGYLTANPSHAGSALKASIYLHLPALIHSNKLQETLIDLNLDGIEVSGIDGAQEEFLGDLVVLSNEFTLGTSEENIASTLQRIARRLSLSEKNKKQEILSRGHIEIKDQVSRAYGLIRHSYKISTLEALEALSLLKLGHDLGWIEKIDQATLIELMSNIRRSHLKQFTSGSDAEPLSADALEHERSSFLHKKLKSVQISI